jgi:putative redox protein
LATVIAETKPGHALTTEITTSTLTFTADEPVGAGGDGLGPSPYDLLLSALGACTVMTVHLYARRKGWALESVRVTLNFERLYEIDHSTDGRSKTRIERISRDIEFNGPLDDGQRQRLLQIAGRCPVHRTLTGDPQIVDRLVELSPVEQRAAD